jgi:hypothetical protein
MHGVFLGTTMLSIILPSRPFIGCPKGTTVSEIASRRVWGTGE